MSALALAAIILLVGWNSWGVAAPAASPSVPAASSPAPAALPSVPAVSSPAPAASLPIPAVSSLTPASAISAFPSLTELDLMRKRQDDFEKFVHFILVPLAIFLGFVAAGGALGVVFAVRNEIRTGQAHSLFVAGETAQQARTEALHSTLLDASEKTITLVNQTLALARDSTERATKALSDRAEQLVREVGEEMAALIARIMMQENFEEKLFKLLVEEPSHRRKLTQLSDRLATVEGYLAFQDIEMEPRAHLVKGMALHLDQEDQAAIPLLERAAEATGMGLRLRLCAYYFIGYAHNNIGEYRAAAAAFDAGHSRASDRAALRDEFERMGAESNFFELVRSHLDGRNVVQSVNDLIRGLTDLSGKVTPKARANLNQTLGNIHLFLARQTGRAASFQEALALFHEAGEGLWAKFGQIEITNEASDKISVVKRSPTVKEVEDLATQNIQTRGEPRSLALLHLATAKCRLWQEAGGTASVRAALSAVNDQMGKVDSDLRLYSLWLRSNVTRKQFIDNDVKRLEDSLSSEANGTSS